MKRFDLSFENLKRDNPHGVTAEVIAQEEADARVLISKHDIDHITDRDVWLDPKKTLCTRIRRTKQKTPEVIKVTTH